MRLNIFLFLSLLNSNFAIRYPKFLPFCLGSWATKFACLSSRTSLLVLSRVLSPRSCYAWHPDPTCSICLIPQVWNSPAHSFLFLLEFPHTNDILWVKFSKWNAELGCIVSRDWENRKACEEVIDLDQLCNKSWYGEKLKPSPCSKTDHRLFNLRRCVVG